MSKSPATPFIETVNTLSRIPAALSWNNGTLRLLDQTRLPAEEAYIDVSSVALLEDCIFRLVVRGAPAIGCAAAFGTVLIAREIPASLTGQAWLKEFDARCNHLIEVRPTAVNLKWAVERCRARVHGLSPLPAPTSLSAILEEEALAIFSEDRQMCDRIGRFGAEWLQKRLGARTNVTLMTHCNAGALATAGSGTALSVMYAAQNLGLSVKVYADETRPLLQGARLTSWELSRAGIDVTVICDNMAASVLRDRKPDAVIVGADRIAANGDTANKIGTYGVAILAKHHGVPFLVAAPSSTFDLSLSDGSKIPIEERNRKEISENHGKLAVPPEAGVFNPAFDVTPAELIAGWITERGVLQPPFSF
ncbi:MAG TPA: S-methyl-5-thioribose-1-phosphate isomerase [Planctomycetota bacterium]|nr:S-methyl-5-thioribose-1-phosphate isomerase [Planctomycetota bacterium]